MKAVVLVTGGARGIGAAIVRAFAPDHDIAFTWHAGADAAEALRAELPGALALHADFADPSVPGTVANTVIARFGRIDVVVNNAAVGGVSASAQPDAPEIARVMQVNVAAPMALAGACLPSMPEGGSIINISSINAARPPAVAGVFAASKAALEAWTISAAREFAPRIRVNAVRPGLVERDYNPRPQEVLDRIVPEIPLARPGTPADIAPAVRFLASPEAAYITGETLTVGGGFGI
ncbi:MAG: SDR family NAD(P)-dependent oxidoreductase [Paracoccaceae bacterium]